jgi:hypothetical protein
MKIVKLLQRVTICLMMMLSYLSAKSQVVINEGSNRNFSTIADEDNEYNDWIELYNSGTDSVNLENYSLTDDNSNSRKWVIPKYKLPPHKYKIIHCSSKDRKPISGFQSTLNTATYTPITGWNTHTMTSPFYWDGSSNIIINVCSYSANGYTTNSIFNQTTTPFYSTVYSYVDNSADACGHQNGTPVQQRPNIMLNGHIIGTGVINNGAYDYPAPYGNWYWSARHQMLIQATELTAAGLSAGLINTLSFDVVSTDPSTSYTYIDFSFSSTLADHVTGTFTPLNTNLNLHTNFSISSSGETVYLFSPSQNQISQLTIDCINVDNSKGCKLDGNNEIVFFNSPTPVASNNNSQAFHQYLQPPVFSKPSGLYSGGFSVNISNPNLMPSTIKYTLDGNDPSLSSPTYNGGNISISSSKVLKAKVFCDTMLSSPLKAASYLIAVNHTTPVLSVITDNRNLYGSTGIFDNWGTDWEKPAYAEYFNTDKSLIFSQPSAIQIDGGAGGSRSNPQHSFRLELNNSVVGGGSVNYPLIPDKPWRNKYSKIYLRNGSNQFLKYPYKDACGVKALCKETKNYYSAYRPVSVYINGSYFGLYELREKFDEEYFSEAEGADSTDILSVSYWYGGVLRAVSGSVDSFYTAYNNFVAINADANDYWEKADKYFDLEYYNDYIIAESFIQNQDWPYNNIKMYRSEKTNHRYRFAVIDVELALQPNGWTSATDNPIDFLFTHAGDQPYTNIWLKSMQNPRFKNYFINRYADILNTSYLPGSLLAIEDSMYNESLPEMPKEYAKWGDPNNITQQMNDFRNNHVTMKSEFSRRGQIVRDFIQSDLGMNGQVHVTLNAFPADGGNVKISTIIPGPLPWTGIYFNGNPIRLTAIANPGYEFSHWDTNRIFRTIDTTSSINLNIDRDVTFTAVFKKTTLVDNNYPTTTDHYYVYPNPSSGNFNIYFNDVNNGSYDIQIFNSLGQIVYSTSATVVNRKWIQHVDIKNLPNGMYVVNINNGSIQHNIKMIISHQ